MPTSALGALPLAVHDAARACLEGRTATVSSAAAQLLAGGSGPEVITSALFFGVTKIPPYSHFWYACVKSCSPGPVAKPPRASFCLTLLGLVIHRYPQLDKITKNWVLRVIIDQVRKEITGVLH